MTPAEATLTAAIVAASVASVGLIWSVISYFVTARRMKSSEARTQWMSRFDKAHALAMSNDPKQALTGALLMKTLSTEGWVTDADRATTASVLQSLPSEVSEPEQVREVLSAMVDRKLAASIAATSPGPKGKFEMYRDKQGDIHWRLKAANGEIIATSPHGYRSHDEALRAIRQFRDGEQPDS